jgi:hypothetical protein
MAFPKKFKNLIELEFKDIEKPDFAWLTYSVCACEKDSCGWGGWMIEWVGKKTKVRYPTSTGDKTLSAKTEQICPICGKNLFRTEVSIKFVPANDQELPLKKGIDYDTVPIEYDE